MNLGAHIDISMWPVMPAMRTCRECGPQSAEKFPKHGLVCLDCIAARSGARYRENRVEILAGQASRYATNPEPKKEHARAYHRGHRDQIAGRNFDKRTGDPIAQLLRGAQRRAHEKGLPFDLVAADIQIPERCPVLGIPMVVNSHKAVGASPSIDRIEAAKGYVKGNIAVISFRANRIKNDASLEEIEAVAKYVRTRLRAASEGAVS